MKLRNKKTGEVAMAEITSDRLFLWFEDGRREVQNFDSLKDLEEWEDYKDQKPYYWFIAGRGAIEYERDEDTTLDRGHKEMGNYFATREEAELAVEKLKAWKRLKDGGITFKNWTINQTGTIDVFATWGDNIPPSRKDPTLLEDLDLLFETTEESSEADEE